jgi:LysM repeat protein
MDPRRIIRMMLVVVLGLAGCVTKENYNAQVLRTNNFQRLLSEEEKRSVELSTEVARLKDQMASLEGKNKALTAQLNDAKAQVVRSLEEVGRLQDEVKQARGGFSSMPALRGPSQEPPDRLGELQAAPAEIPEKKADKKKGKAEAKVKVQTQSQSPPPQPKAAPPAPLQATPPAPLLRTPSQEPPDRLGEIQEKPAAKPVAKPEKKVESKKGKATAKITVQKKGEAPPPSPPPQAESPAPPTPPPAKAEAKAKVPAKTETEVATDDSFFRYHKVKKGETLADIAKQYRTDAQTLRELNDMASGDAVRPGDRLIVGQKPL